MRKFLATGLILGVALALPVGSGIAGAQTDEEVMSVQTNNNEDPCFIGNNNNPQISGVHPDGTPYEVGDVVTLEYHAKNGFPAEDCFGITLYIHPDNDPARPHEGSAILFRDEVTSSVKNKNRMNFTHTLTVTEPGIFACGTQLDVYKGPEIENFSGGDRYGSPVNRLLAHSNWVSDDPTCAPGYEECEWNGDLSSSDPECVGPPTTTETPVPEPTTPTTSTTEPPISTSTTVPSTSSPSTTETFSPAATSETLPHTGSMTLPLIALGLILLATGGTVLAVKKRVS